MASTGIRTKLSMETLLHIATYLPSRDLCSLLRVSRPWFAASCTILWSEVQGVKQILDLIDGPFHGTEGNDQREIDSVAVGSLLSNQGVTFNFTRFDRYSPYVNKLVLHQGAISDDLYDLLRRKAEHAPLLPKLRVLWTEPAARDHGGFEPGWGIWRRPLSIYQDLDRLTLLFLSSTIETLAISGDSIALHPLEIWSRARKIKDIRVRYVSEDCTSEPNYPFSLESRSQGASRTGTLVHRSCCMETIPGAWPRALVESMSEWEQLRSLTINSLFLRFVTLADLSLIPQLSRLVIWGRLKDANLDVLLSQPVVFPKLTHLSVLHASGAEACQLFGCRSLMRGIKELVWNANTDYAAGDREFQSFVASILALGQHAVQLSELSLDLEEASLLSSPWSAKGIRGAFGSFKLVSLHLRDQWHTKRSEDLLQLLVATGSQLERLRIEKACFMVDQLPIIAANFPALCELRLSLNAQDTNSYAIPDEFRATGSKPIEFVIDFEQDGWPELAAEQELEVQCNFTRYIQSLWPGCVVRPTEWVGLNHEDEEENCDEDRWRGRRALMEMFTMGRS